MTFIQKTRHATVLPCLAAMTTLSTPTISFAKAEQTVFSGPHVGAAIGAVDQQLIILERFGTATQRELHVNRWGLGGELFAGYDIMIAKRLLIGGEAQLGVGGGSPVFNGATGTIGIKPRYGFSVTGRLGYVASPKILLYAGGGYGGQEYRGILTDNVSARTDRFILGARSFVLRAGAERSLSKHTSIRLEFEHFAGRRNQFLIGVPIRF